MKKEHGDTRVADHPVVADVHVTVDPCVRTAGMVTTDLREGGTEMAASINERYELLHAYTVRLADRIKQMMPIL